MLSLAASDFTAFHAIGIAFACWAVLVTFLGVTRPDFPGKVKGGGEKAVLGIPVLLALGAIGTAIGTAKNEKKETAEAAPAAPAAPPGATQLKLSTDPTGNLKFSTDVLTAGKPGPVQITLSNPSPVQHNITLQTPQGTKGGPTVAKGKTSTVVADLQPGKYVYYCSVPGHREGGMQGELTVK